MHSLQEEALDVHKILKLPRICHQVISRCSWEVKAAKAKRDCRTATEDPVPRDKDARGKNTENCLEMHNIIQGKIVS